MREAMLKRFDQDQDGKLSDEERAAARKAFEARRGGGPGNRGPRGAGRGAGEGRPDREKMRAAMLKRFDKDGDGKLSDDERAEMRKQFEARRGGRGRGGDRAQPANGSNPSEQGKSDSDTKPDESSK